MKDIFDKIDSLNATFGLSSDKDLDDMKVFSKKVAQAFQEERIEQNFVIKVEEALNDEKFSNLAGKFYSPSFSADSRLVNMVQMIDDCVQRTEDKEYGAEHPLYMKKEHAKKIKLEARKMFDFMENVLLKGINDNLKPTDTQAYLNERSVGQKGEKKEGTMKHIKAFVQKINFLESVGVGEVKNYSSNIKTTKELEDFKGIKTTKTEGGGKNKQMSKEDYNKAFEPIFEKLKNDPKTVTEAEAAFILAGEFMLRPSSILKININQVDVKGGTIEIEAEQNKSAQMFLAKSNFFEPNNMTAQIILSGLRIRAAELHEENEDGNIKLVACSEANLYQGFDNITRKYGISKRSYEGKYKLLRHMKAQELYDDIRQSYDYKDIPTIEKKTEALKEVNYLMGHEGHKLTTTMEYIKNIW